LAEEKKNQNKINDYIILNNRKLELEGNTIKFSLENAFQIDYLNIFRTEIIDFLRAKTESTNLNLEYWIEKKVENERKAYTPSEKYQYLLAKHPKLGELRNKLGLDLEY
jgi:DNA polymerase III subunit gamma/tau